MKTKGLSLASIVVVTAVGLYGCSEGDEAVINITSTEMVGDDSGGGSTSNPTSVCPDWTLARPQTDDSVDVCQLPAEIMENQTLTSDKIWFMASRVTVGNGNQEMGLMQGTLADSTPVANVVLTIEAGTQIQGRTGSFANLIITRGSRIEANGTGALPIVFSSDDEGFDGTGEWGGLILHGYASHNECLIANQGAAPGGPAAVACNIDSEGESGFAGGYDDADSSGTLRYVVVAEGGFEFDIGDEINGISMVGVGAGTTMDYIQVHGNADDGVEFYGGTVNASHLVLTNNLDDTVDWDEGWQGNLQYVLVVQGADTTGNAIEADSAGNISELFWSKPTIANATFIGNGSRDILAVFKASSGGFVHHSVFTFDAAVTVATTCIDSVEAGPDEILEGTNNVADCGTSGDTSVVAAPIADVALAADYSSGAAQAAGLAALDIDALNVTYAESVADPDFFDATTYAGAVDPAGGDDWYAGWTIEGSL